LRPAVPVSWRRARPGGDSRRSLQPDPGRCLTCAPCTPACGSAACRGHQSFTRPPAAPSPGPSRGRRTGTLSMLQLPDDPFVTIELAGDPAQGNASPGTGISHLVIQAGSLDAALASLAAQGIAAEPPGLPGGANGPRGSPTRTATAPNSSSGPPATPTASPRPTSPEQPARSPACRPPAPAVIAGPMPAAAAGHAATALPPATLTSGHTSTEAQVAISPILRGLVRAQAGRRPRAD
jgi:hypothetical protein